MRRIFVEKPRIHLRAARRPSRGRALLVYLNGWWLPWERLRKQHSHQNIHQSRAMAEALTKAGYDCDVVHYLDRDFVVDQRYDVIVSHRFDVDFLPEAMGRDALKILLVSTQPPWLNNPRGAERTRQVRAERGPAVEGYRHVVEDADFLACADVVCCFGETSVAQAWSSGFTGSVLPFNNWAFQLSEVPVRDWDESRRSCLYYASATQVHKGLDLALQAAARRPDFELAVCGFFERETGFCAAFRRELFESPNVKPIGALVGSAPLFQERARLAAFSVLPSVGEGSPGSLIETAATGLVPIISRHCGVDWPEAIFLDDLSLPAMEAALAQAESMGRSEWEARSQAVARRVREAYTAEAFARRWDEIVTTLLGPAG